ncbi:MAG: hypothetical protein M0P76_06010 [Candidatus Pacebacteria bacterium]|jgi:hypothetical protein|nr:hypothetical protein [Candidatus Paceibacterota bacterium]
MKEKTLHERIEEATNIQNEEECYAALRAINKELDALPMKEQIELQMDLPEDDLLVLLGVAVHDGKLNAE